MACNIKKVWLLYNNRSIKYITQKCVCNLDQGPEYTLQDLDSLPVHLCTPLRMNTKLQPSYFCNLSKTFSWNLDVASKTHEHSYRGIFFANKFARPCHPYNSYRFLNTTTYMILRSSLINNN